MGNFSKFLCPIVFKIVFTLTFTFVIIELSWNFWWKLLDSYGHLSYLASLFLCIFEGKKVFWCCCRPNYNNNICSKFNGGLISVLLLKFHGDFVLHRFTVHIICLVLVKLRLLAIIFCFRESSHWGARCERYLIAFLTSSLQKGSVNSAACYK